MHRNIYWDELQQYITLIVTYCVAFIEDFAIKVLFFYWFHLNFFTEGVFNEKI